jgi:hypothetical protein
MYGNRIAHDCAHAAGHNAARRRDPAAAHDPGEKDNTGNVRGGVRAGFSVSSMKVVKVEPLWPVMNRVFGARGGIRTHTPLAELRILSPMRLPVSPPGRGRAMIPLARHPCCRRRETARHVCNTQGREDDKIKRLKCGMIIAGSGRSATRRGPGPTYTASRGPCRRKQ